MLMGFDLTRLDDLKIRSIRTALRTIGIKMKIDPRENDRYLTLEAESYQAGLALLALAQNRFKSLTLPVVVWDVDMGEFVSKEKWDARLGATSNDDYDIKNDRDPLCGDYGRSDY